ncbi:MAG TPA: tRNA (adenosine(37)-N6)-threonylcarbamoyltransferase complex ATPase subunit type 1 TsaE [Chthoniobacterales bacterium]
MATFISHSAAETIAFAQNWAQHLQPNDIVALRGDLGAGKTHFVKGIVSSFGSSETVTSPTFTLLHEYRAGRLPIFHFDFYRIENRAAVENIGFEDYLEENGLAVIEWADRYPELLPGRARWVDFAIESAEERRITT